MFRFYFQPVDAKGMTGTRIDIEALPGVRYSAATGLEARGEIKNVYSEEYAEQDGIRVWHPCDSGEEARYKVTTVKISLIFTGATQRDQYRSLCNVFRSGRVYYWDTARHQKVLLLMTAASEPEDDIIKGIPFISSTFTFTNLWGCPKKCDDSGKLI